MRSFGSVTSQVSLTSTARETINSTAAGLHQESADGGGGGNSARDEEEVGEEGSGGS